MAGTECHLDLEHALNWVLLGVIWYCSDFP